MGNNTKVDQNAADQQLADGLTQNAKQIGSIPVGGKQLKPTDVATVLQARIAARQAAMQARTNLQAKVADQKAEIASSRALVRAVKAVLRVMLSNDSTMLGTLGLATIPHPATPATKVAAAAKAGVTKAAHATKASPAPASKPQA
jgi:hypothetical protein